MKPVHRPRLGCRLKLGAGLDPGSRPEDRTLPGLGHRSRPGLVFKLSVVALGFLILGVAGSSATTLRRQEKSSFLSTPFAQSRAPSLVASLTASSLTASRPASLAASSLTASPAVSLAGSIATSHSAQPDTVMALWVFFKDKGPSGETAQSLSELEKRFSPRALARRARVRSGPLVDSRDLPVCVEYVQTLRDLGLDVKATSKWLNAVSVRCRTSDRDVLSRLSFVRKLQRVASFPKREIPFEPITTKPADTETSQKPAGAGLSREPNSVGVDQKPLDGASTSTGRETIEPRPSEPQPGMAPGDTSFYGPTWRQLNLIQVPALHKQGFTGAGMFIGVLDTGFNLLHQALKNVHVVAQWDFINWDSVTANQPGQDSSDQHNHGTMILGEIAGNKPGVYMGAAYGAEFALAKTEYVPTETRVEEDYWVMGLEWLDSLGVDLVTSSLGYIDWYTYQNMDGNTAVTTVAADMAVANGVSIFNAMGNGGITLYPYMIAPADGDSVMSIGAVDSLGVLWPLSSRGPTYDKRIKPEVVAQGKLVYVVNPNDSTGYGRASGTSCSTPLAAGACALVLQKNPGWNPIMLREAVRSTATNASSPDTAIGWGILRAQLASDYEVISVADDRTPRVGTANVAIYVENVPNPFNPATAIRVELKSPGSPGGFSNVISRRVADLSAGIPGVTAGIFDVGGRCLKDFGTLRFEGNSCTVLWDGNDGSGKSLPSGVYFFTATAGETSKTRKLVLLR